MALDNFRTQKIIWDRANKKIVETVEANSGDSNGRKLVVQIINQEVTESLSGTTLSLGWKSRNGAKGLDAFNVVDASKGIFEIYYTTEMLSNIGNIEASLIFIDSTGRIESSTFTISVRPSTVDDESVESENSFTALTEALVKVNDFDAQLAQKAEDSEVRKKEIKLEPEDASERFLSLMTGQGIVNLETIPQDGSVTPSKLDKESKSVLNLKDEKAILTYHELTGDDVNLTTPSTFGRTRFIAEPSIRGGVIKKIRAFANTSTTFIIKVLRRIEGNNFITYAQQALDLRTGENVVDVEIPIGQGMYIGYYSDTGVLRTVIGVEEDVYYIVGNIDGETTYSLTKQRMMLEAEIEYDSLAIRESSFSPAVIKDVSVVAENTVNLLDERAVILGGLYSPSNGNWTENTSYYTSDFIPVSVGGYRKTNNASVVFWDKDKKYVTGQTAGTVFNVVNPTIKYITLAIHINDLQGLMLTKEDEYPSEYIPYTVDRYLLSDKWSVKENQKYNSLIDEVSNRTEIVENMYGKYTEPIKLNLTDFSGYNQPYHPSVIYIEGGFNGYEYWMVQTPYPIGASPYRDRWESPVVYKSIDGINWITVADPLDDVTPEEIAKRDYMSDPHIVYRPDTTTLEVWYRLTNSTDNGLKTVILRKTTKNGLTWTEREVMIPPSDRSSQHFMRSPSIIWDNTNNLYRAWYQNDFGLFYETSVNGKVWDGQQKLSLDVPHSHWHIDVNYFSGEYHLLSYSLTQDVVYYTSKDGINFIKQRKLLDSNDGNPLYSTGLYRAVSLLDGDGKARVYFTAETENRVTKIGLMIGDSINDMQGVQKLASEMVVLNSGITLEELAQEVAQLKKILT